MEIPFKPDTIEGNEHVMSLKGLKINEIRLTRGAGNIVFVCENPALEKKKKVAPKKKITSGGK